MLCFAEGCDDKPQEATEALFEAAEAGDLKRVQALVADGADVNATRSHGVTALDMVASRGYTESMMRLRANVSTRRHLSSGAGISCIGAPAKPSLSIGVTSHGRIR